MSTGRLAGRVAVVTGGGQGIGRAVVRRFAAEGARVLVAELDEASGRDAVAEVTQSAGLRCSGGPTSATGNRSRRWWPPRWRPGARWTCW